MRSSKYLEYIRSCFCEVTGTDQDVVAHHVRLGFFGTGIKPSDFRSVPLSAEQHARLHHIGEKRFWENYGMDPDQVILRHLLVYIAKQGDPEVIPALEEIALNIASR